VRAGAADVTEDLIDKLSRDLSPTRPQAVARRLGLAIGLGAVAALIGVGWLLGPRPDMAQAVGSRMFWMKLAYTGAFAAVGLSGVERLARPGGVAGKRLAWLWAPVIAVALMSAAQIARTPPGALRHLFMGDSATACPWLIAAVSAPLFVALFWAVRGLAPTRLRVAGAAAGLTAGGFGALIYCLHCTESGAPFVAIWYSLGILTPCVLGALLGPRLLRW